MATAADRSTGDVEAQKLIQQCREAIELDKAQNGGQEGGQGDIEPYVVLARLFDSLGERCAVSRFCRFLTAWE
jgi:hypothetical protein